MSRCRLLSSDQKSHHQHSSPSATFHFLRQSSENKLTVPWHFVLWPDWTPTFGILRLCGDVGGTGSRWTASLLICCVVVIPLARVVFKEMLSMVFCGKNVFTCGNYYVCKSHSILTNVSRILDSSHTCLKHLYIFNPFKNIYILLILSSFSPVRWVLDAQQTFASYT